MISLYTKEVADQFLRENFRKLMSFLNKEQPILRGEWKFFDITITGNTTLTYPHSFMFTPTDVIQTSVVFRNSVGIPATGTLTWNYSSFNGTNIYVTTSGMSATDTARVRAFIGRYGEN